MEEMGPWDGDRAALDRPSSPAVDRRPTVADDDGLRLATWKQMLDNGSMQDGDDTCGPPPGTPVARRQPARVRRPRPTVTVTGDRGSVTLPAESSPTCPTTWCGCRRTRSATACSPTSASPGSTVTVKGADQ